MRRATLHLRIPLSPHHPTGVPLDHVVVVGGGGRRRAVGGAGAGARAWAWGPWSITQCHHQQRRLGLLCRHRYRWQMPSSEGFLGFEVWGGEGRMEMVSCGVAAGRWVVRLTGRLMGGGWDSAVHPAQQDRALLDDCRVLVKGDPRRRRCDATLTTRLIPWTNIVNSHPSSEHEKDLHFYSCLQRGVIYVSHRRDRGLHKANGCSMGRLTRRA